MATAQRMFPSREIMLRTDARVWFFRLSSGLQASAAAIALVLGGWAAFASVSYVVHDNVIAAKDNEILNVRLSYRSLLNEVSDYQSKFSVLTKELEENHGLMLNLVETNATLQRSLRSAETQLVDRTTRNREVENMRTALKSRLGEIEREMRSLNTYNFELKDNLTVISTDLEQALTERNQARNQGERLQGIVDNLEQKLVALHETEKDVLDRLTKTTAENIDGLENVLTRTGLKLETLLASNKPDQGSENLGRGGPFVAAPPDSEPATRLKASLETLDSKLERWDDLQQLMQQLPLQPPLDFFTVTSRFGKRRDPVNRRWAMHYGLDMAAAKRTPVYSAAPGTVIYAARKGRFGNFVEIDHGRGLKTRFGHLDKILVKKGQKVEYRAKIGLVGNTGRSTGPHLHYEVHMNKKPLDPWKFIRAGRYVYQR